MADLPLCKDVDSFKAALKKATRQIAVVHFEADWASECNLINDVLKELAKEHKHTVFIRVSAEDVADVTQSYGVECVPTCVILKELKPIDKVEGADAGKLAKAVKFHATSFTAPIVTSSHKSLEDRLKSLINSHPCMLFMKGSPDEPRCGFSKQIIQIFRENDVQFGSFDILNDNDVRQGLKKFSDWPTYPQVYSSGELVGGLDIIRELVENGELLDTLPKAEDLNSRIKKIIESAPVMIFMKGEPQKPQCKFSKALMEILNKTTIKFSSFNIFEDEEVRQGLKTYSNWPTFPQIYVKGELVGGLDIIKELDETGELVSTLTAE